MPHVHGYHSEQAVKLAQIAPDSRIIFAAFLHICDNSTVKFDRRCAIYFISVTLHGTISGFPWNADNRTAG
ncbi:MAG TPA: hypothetical protein PLJ34_07535, partial [Hyphomicrobiales bacterium]|nr:hypothetical protein [Hyphomicrobiales bacterium]